MENTQELPMTLACRGIIDRSEIDAIVDGPATKRVEQMLTDAGFKYQGGSCTSYHDSGNIRIGSTWSHSEETWTEENKHEIVHINYKTIDALDKAGKFMTDNELVASDLISDRLLFAIPENYLSKKGKDMHDFVPCPGYYYGTDGNFTEESKMREEAHAMRHSFDAQTW